MELRSTSYARSKYAEFTREINTWFNAPTVILFKTVDNRFTLAFVHRRQHRYDPTRDVLGSVSLVREINPTQPHRAHLDILAELSLENLLSWMGGHNKPYNFDGLLAAWLDTLDTEALNKRFYTDLFHWFEWAVGEATFPTQEQKILQPEEHIIRLITRLLFVWFIKEKGLVADDVFNETKISDLLKNYDRDSGDSYYRAVLQNLFFATLNTEIGKRGFSKEKNATHRNFSLYRYKQEIVDPKKLLALFERTPFINGGLFDCLDSEEATSDGGYRIDCFTDNVTNPKRKEYGILSIPNRLFFDDDGLIALLNHYKFTVEENTPVEQEVALDPELLGKVFENLLAAYNPEDPPNGPQADRLLLHPARGGGLHGRRSADCVTRAEMPANRRRYKVLAGPLALSDGLCGRFQRRQRTFRGKRGARRRAGNCGPQGAGPGGWFRCLSNGRIAQTHPGLEKNRPRQRTLESPAKRTCQSKERTQPLTPKTSKNAMPNCWKSAKPLKSIQATLGASCT